MMQDLFADQSPGLPAREEISHGGVLLRGFALAPQDALLHALAQITAQAPFRHMVTPGGFTMSVAMTNCGTAGWVADRGGYRYASVDPHTGTAWPAMPPCFRTLAIESAQQAGYPDFQPDACLINRYVPGAKLSMHQDKDEQDLSQPIVSVSLGLPAVFHFGGLRRDAPVRKYALHHGDVVVWGGASRLNFHAVAPLKNGLHPLLEAQRINLTFRRVRAADAPV